MTEKPDSEKTDEERRQSEKDRRLHDADRRGDGRVKTKTTERRTSDERRKDS